ncbi:MAG: 3-isopropylmalate dehydratase small subunit [candidate division WOR-3 bacterium]
MESHNSGIKNPVFRGRAWCFGDDIDTDQIYPGKYLPLTDKVEMAKHAMEGTDRGEEFLKHVQPGDIIVAGKNFGCGSSREHAAIAIKGAGINLVIAESFARIFHRNCVNTALITLELKEAKEINDGDILEVNVDTGEVNNLTQGKRYKAAPLSELEKEIINAGGLLKYLKSAG